MSGAQLEEAEGWTRVMGPECKAYLVTTLLGIVDLCAGEGILMRPERTADFMDTQFKRVDDSCRWDSGRLCAFAMERGVEASAETGLGHLMVIRDSCPRDLPFSVPCADSSTDQMACLNKRIRTIIDALHTAPAR